MYLGRANFTDSYGAAGSLIVVLVWVYYSAQVLYLGAEFTRVYACRFGSMRAHNNDGPSGSRGLVKERLVKDNKECR